MERECFSRQHSKGLTDIIGILEAPWSVCDDAEMMPRKDLEANSIVRLEHEELSVDMESGYRRYFSMIRIPCSKNRKVKNRSGCRYFSMIRIPCSVVKQHKKQKVKKQKVKNRKVKNRSGGGIE